MLPPGNPAMRDIQPTPSIAPKSSPGSWTPILDGEEGAQAREVIRAITQALQPLQPTLLPEKTTAGSLAGGSAGLAVFYAGLAGSGLVDDAEESAVDFLNQAVEAVAAARSTPALYSGFTGAAWAMAHLDGRIFDADGDDPNNAVDKALRELLRRSPWRGDYDLVSGLVGFGIYALERPRPVAIECLSLVIDRLDEMAVRTPGGVAWFTAPEQLSAPQRNDSSQGHYDLGLAHGVAGVIALLGQVCASADERLHSVRRKARMLLDGAVAWLLAQEPKDRTQSFPYWVGPGVSPRPARLAWCYGDLGIAVALLQAARGAQQTAWEQEALRIARRAARRRAEESGVVDCGLCHGAAGVGHLFSRLFQATGDETLRDAARIWFARALAMRQVPSEIAGFPAWTRDPERPDDMRWGAEPGLLEGVAGVALALLAATTDVEPEWDRMMLVSISGGQKPESPGVHPR